MQYQNVIVCFRIPESLRDRLKKYADDNEKHLSAIIRMACSDFLKRTKETSISERNEN